MLGLLTAKPVLYVCNVEEAAAAQRQRLLGQGRRSAPKEEGAEAVVVSAKIESEIAVLSAERAGRVPGSRRPRRARPQPRDPRGLRPAWPRHLFHRRARRRRAPGRSPRAPRPPQAAGVIHTDFEKGFIRAETIAYDDYVALKGEAGARDAGKFRLEGKEYVVQDGDVLHFRFAN